MAEQSLRFTLIMIKEIFMDKGTNEYDADEPVMGYNGYFFELDEDEEDE